MYIYIGRKFKISTVAFVATVMFFVQSPLVVISAICAIVIHESGHMIAGRLCGANVSKIIVCGLGASIEFDRSFGAYDEITVLGAGMLFNLLSASAATLFGGKLTVFIVFSLGYAMVNMLPIPTLDGGGIFSSVVALKFPYWIHRKLCGTVSFVFLFILWQIGIFILFKTEANITPFLMCMCLFFELFCKM